VSGGVNPNPNGRPKVVAEIRSLAREYGPHAIARLAELSKSREGAVAVNACRVLLDRGYGRPEQAIEVTSGAQGDSVSAFEFASFQANLIRILDRFPDAREAVVAEFEKLRLAPRALPPPDAIDAEVA
jgi:hypothetical protein